MPENYFPLTGVLIRFYFTKRKRIAGGMECSDILRAEVHFAAVPSVFVLMKTAENNLSMKGEEKVLRTGSYVPVSADRVEKSDRSCPEDLCLQWRMPEIVKIIQRIRKNRLTFF